MKIVEYITGLVVDDSINPKVIVSSVVLTSLGTALGVRYFSTIMQYFNAMPNVLTSNALDQKQHEQLVIAYTEYAEVVNVQRDQISEVRESLKSLKKDYSRNINRVRNKLSQLSKKSDNKNVTLNISGECNNSELKELERRLIVELNSYPQADESKDYTANEIVEIMKVRGEHHQVVMTSFATFLENSYSLINEGDVESVCAKQLAN